jgi:hypothetical protein
MAIFNKAGTGIGQAPSSSSSAESASHFYAEAI